MGHSGHGHVEAGGGGPPRIPPALRRALDHRDRGCRFPGCGLPSGQGHHVRHWANGGPTTLSNLALLCRRHHRAVHEEGYRVDRQPDGALRFRRPDGELLPAVPPPATVPVDPVEVLRARHDAQGLRVHARTSMPGWLGERLDVGWAIDVLHPLAAGKRSGLTTKGHPAPPRWRRGPAARAGAFWARPPGPPPGGTSPPPGPDVSATTLTRGSRRRLRTFWVSSTLSMVTLAGSCRNHIGIASGAPSACTVASTTTYRVARNRWMLSPSSPLTSRRAVDTPRSPSSSPRTPRTGSGRSSRARSGVARRSQDRSR